MVGKYHTTMLPLKMHLKRVEEGSAFFHEQGWREVCCLAVSLCCIAVLLARRVSLASRSRLAHFWMCLASIFLALGLHLAAKNGI